MRKPSSAAENDAIGLSLTFQVGAPSGSKRTLSSERLVRTRATRGPFLQHKDGGALQLPGCTSWALETPDALNKHDHVSLSDIPLLLQLTTESTNIALLRREAAPPRRPRGSSHRLRRGLRVFSPGCRCCARRVPWFSFYWD
eukprot:TRINITY_DN34682_c0_g2_i2.p1 TRINITY_DN34682_c0_g2~~TRINITY_DN34682_c0_g2_i2.p1  ORF type:complete len:142 (+),score=11.49 TRINITY_DN34682_c0_g2_i2:352-777(+)